MSEPTIDQITAEIVQTLRQAREAKTSGVVVVRCSGPREVDHARELLRRTKAPFAWKSQPVSEIDPPDLIGYVTHKGAGGPAYLAYELPTDEDGKVLARFHEFLTGAWQRFAKSPILVVMLLTMDEIRAVSRGAPDFWQDKKGYVAWPATNVGNRFMPAVDVGGMSERRGGMRSAGGGLQSGFSVASAFGDLDIDFGIAFQDDGVTPWAGAPFKEGDEIPDYIANAAAPAGRRWGRILAPGDREGAELIDQCRILLDQHQTEHARQGLAKAAKHFRSRSNHVATAEAYVMLGRASEIRFDHSVALEWYEQALQLYEQIEDAAGISDCCAMTGFLRFVHGDLDGAFSFFDRALRRDEEEGDELRMASGYRRIGIVLEQRSELEQAQALYERASEIERDNGDQHALARSLHHQARIAGRSSEYETASRLLTESLEIKEALEDEAGLATGQHEQGNLFMQQGQLEDSLQSYEKALELERKIMDVQGIAVTQAQIGLAKKELFYFADAVRAFTIARELFYRLQSPHVAVMEDSLIGITGMVDRAIFDDMQHEARAYVDGLIVT